MSPQSAQLRCMINPLVVPTEILNRFGPIVSHVSFESFMKFVLPTVDHINSVHIYNHLGVTHLVIFTENYQLLADLILSYPLDLPLLVLLCDDNNLPINNYIRLAPDLTCKYIVGPKHKNMTQLLVTLSP